MLASILPMLWPMIIWVIVASVFGLFQVWWGASKYRHRKLPVPSWIECIRTSIADGNLFIFSIATAGGVFAVTLMEISSSRGQLFQFIQVGALLILASVFVIFFSAHFWAEAKSGTSHQSAKGRPRSAPTRYDLHGLIDDTYIPISIRLASASFICALITEGLRLAEVFAA